MFVMLRVLIGCINEVLDEELYLKEIKNLVYDVLDGLFSFN